MKPSERIKELTDQLVKACLDSAREYAERIAGRPLPGMPGPNDTEMTQIHSGCAIGAIVVYLDEQHERTERAERAAKVQQLLRIAMGALTNEDELNAELESIGLARVVAKGMNRMQAVEAIRVEAAAKRLT